MAQPRTGVGQQAISLPCGPGTISGLDETFNMNLNAGSVAFSVAIRVPPGVAQLQPNL
jgi:hypothetical protein